MKKARVICGIDEAGRGALAGPLVAAAVILPCSMRRIQAAAGSGIADGKLLSPKRRRKIYSALKQLGAPIAIEVISARQINNRGIQRANREAIRRLVKRMEADEYVIDGNIKIGGVRGKTDRIRTVVDADATIVPTILAGIVAKVVRDTRMLLLHRQFPRYGWNRNAGYGTKRHVAAIRLYSTCRFHRGVFVTTALKKSEEAFLLDT